MTRAAYAALPKVERIQRAVELLYVRNDEWPVTLRQVVAEVGLSSSSVAAYWTRIAAEQGLIETARGRYSTGGSASLRPTAEWRRAYSRRMEEGAA